MTKSTQEPQLIVHGDGSVWRTAICSCGTTIYKKNLTSNEIEFLVKRDRQGFYLNQVVYPLGNPSVIKIICPNCKSGHIVCHISENITVGESCNTKSDPVE